MNALELRGLTKHYKDFTLGPLDLTLPGGTICGLIGENGAGKSTTIRLILDMVQRDGGTVTILGRDNRTVSVRTKEEISVVLGSEGIPLHRAYSSRRASFSSQSSSLPLCRKAMVSHSFSKSLTMWEEMRMEWFSSRAKSSSRSITSSRTTGSSPLVASSNSSRKRRSAWCWAARASPCA